MKFGGGDDGGEVSDFHRALIEDYVNHEQTRDDIERELANVGEEEGAFWDEFREKYEPFATIDGSGGDAFLDSLGGPVAHEPGVYFDLERGEVHEPEQRPAPGQRPPAPTPQTPVPGTPVPSPGRGRRDEAKKPNAVVRVGRRIGRWLGIGRNKKR